MSFVKSALADERILKKIAAQHKIPLELLKEEYEYASQLEDEGDVSEKKRLMEQLIGVQRKIENEQKRKSR